MAIWHDKKGNDTVYRAHSINLIYLVIAHKGILCVSIKENCTFFSFDKEFLVSFNQFGNLNQWIDKTTIKIES